MDGLIVTVNDREYPLEPGQTLTFGRDALCTICFGSTDTGISRVAGSIGYDGGTWWIVNRSASRILQVVDQTGISRPIPVAGASGEPSRRAVDLKGPSTRRRPSVRSGWIGGGTRGSARRKPAGRDWPAPSSPSV